MTAWEDGHHYVIEVDVATYPARYRMLFRTFTGTWRVDPAGAGCRVSIDFDADLRGGPVLQPIVGLMSRRARGGLERSLDSYGEQARRAVTRP